MSFGRTLRSFVAKHPWFAFEAAILLILVAVGTVWTNNQSRRPLLAEMACDGYLFPGHVEDRSVVKRDLNGPTEQKAAFSEAARRVGFDRDAAQVAGDSAAVLCNQPNKSR